MLKTLTIHGVEEEVEKLVKKRAKEEGRSVNKVVKDLIGQSLGVGELRKDNKLEFADLCGVWTEADAAEFLGSIGDMGEVDKEDWQ